MITWALIATGISLVFGYLNILQMKSRKTERDADRVRIVKLERDLAASEIEVRRQKEINTKLEEINAKANDEKQNLVTGDPGADARAATDVLHDLANHSREAGSSSGELTFPSVPDPVRHRICGRRKPA
jgi:hypothetical protein